MALGVTNDSNYRLIAAALRSRTADLRAKWTPAQMPPVIRSLAVNKAIVALYDSDIPENTTIYFTNDNTGTTTQIRVNSTGATIRALTEYEIATPLTMTVRLGYGDVQPTETFNINNDDSREIFFADFRTHEPEPEPEPLPDGYTAVPSVKVGSANKGGIVGVFTTSVPIANVYKIELIAKEEKTPITNSVSFPITLKYGSTNAVRLQFNSTGGTYHTPTFGIASQTISVGTYNYDFNLFRKYELYMAKASSALFCDGVICRTSGTTYTTNTSPMIIDLFTTGTAVTSQISIQSVKIYDINGELLEEVRPCTRDEDGAIGMYAMKSGIFGSNNISGGELIVGE